MKILIRGGRVIDPASQRDELADVLVDGERVAQIGGHGRHGPADQTIDATGCIVSPGFIDLHVHLREPGFEGKETIASGTRASAAGGFTAVCAMANTNPVNDCALVTRRIQESAAATASTRVHVIGALTRGLAGETLADLGDMAAAGCVAFSDDGMPVMNSAVMRRGLEYANTFGRPVISHAEDRHLSAGGIMHEGVHSCVLGVRGTPAAAETVMVARDIELAELTGAHVHIAHVSTAGALRHIRSAKSRGLRVTCEVAPHHLALIDQDVGRYDTNKRMYPPLRTGEDRDALIAALADGTVDAVATDHAPHDSASKALPFEEAANGVVGVETALAILLDLVHKGRLTLMRSVELLTSGPARTLNLPGGSLKTGGAADLTVWDPEASWKVDPSALRSKSKNSAFLGWQMRGQVRYTLLGGKATHSVDSSTR